MVLSLDRWVEKVAVVTNIGSDCGAAVAEKLVEEGLLVVGLTRNSEDVEKLPEKFEGKKGKFYAIQANVSKEKDIKAIIKWATKYVGPIHILVNMGGIHVRESPENGDAGVFQRSVDVNVKDLCLATREAIKIMRKYDIAGHIVHINSIVGHKITRPNAVQIYPAAKHAITALTDSLRLKLNSLNSKIKVTSINPGCVNIPRFDLETRKSELFQHFKEGYTLESQDIADAVVYVLSTPPHVQIHELTIKPINEIS